MRDNAVASHDNAIVMRDNAVATRDNVIVLTDDAFASHDGVFLVMRLLCSTLSRVGAQVIINHTVTGV